MADRQIMQMRLRTFTSTTTTVLGSQLGDQGLHILQALSKNSEAEFQTPKYDEFWTGGVRILSLLVSLVVFLVLDAWPGFQQPCLPLSPSLSSRSKLGAPRLFARDPTIDNAHAHTKSEQFGEGQT